MARTLPAGWYGDPEIHERERRAVFGNEWLFVGLRQTLQEPGDYLATDIAGWNVVVVVDDEGDLRAHHNVCRHRAGPLAEAGRGRVPSLVCRYHGWAYALDGTLRSARDFGDTIDLIDCDALMSLQVDTWRGLVFINVGENGAAPPLLESLGSFVDACAGYPIESFVPGPESDHELACNWKTYADNYLEGYHIPLVHPALNKEIDAKRYHVEIDEDYRWVAPLRTGP